MTPPRGQHTCIKEAEIKSLKEKVDKIDENINGADSEDPGMKGQINRLLTIVTPMAGDVKTATEFITKYEERERLQKEDSSKKNVTWNTIFNAAIAITAVAAIIIALKAKVG